MPKYGWSDLAYSLARTAAATRTRRPRNVPASTPIGIVKLSYFNGFYAIGTTDGTFETGTTRSGPTAAGERPIRIPAWRVRLADAGDPYDIARAEDPIVAQARRGLTEFRGSHYALAPPGSTSRRSGAGTRRRR